VTGDAMTGFERLKTKNTTTTNHEPQTTAATKKNGTLIIIAASIYDHHYYAFIMAAAKSSSSSSSLSPTALFFMGLLALQFGIQPIVTKKFTSPEIIKSTVIFTQEIVKLLIAMMGITLNSSSSWKDVTNGWTIGSWLRLALLPATIYLIQNLCSLLAYQNLDAITYNVLNQTKTLSAALCCYLLLGKRQSKLQIVALVILLVAALVMEGVLPLNLEYYMNLSNATTAAADSKFSLSSKHFSHGVLPIMTASFLSGLAGAITQKSLQSGGGRNALMFTMELCVASILILLVSFATSEDGKQIQQRGFFDKWSLLTMVPILTNSAGGILVGLVIKYAGTIRKGFALIFGILISGIVQSLIDEDKSLSKEDIAGGALAALSLWMHATFPYADAPKKSKAKAE
jgi:UDP-sugar transporter A1/2/3